MRRQALLIVRYYGHQESCLGLATIESLLKAIVVVDKWNYANVHPTYLIDFDVNKIEFTRQLQSDSIWMSARDDYIYDFDERILRKSGLASDESFSIELARNNRYHIIHLYDSSYTQEQFDKIFPPPRKAISKAMRQLVYDKCEGHCSYCGKPLAMEEMQVDHIKSHYYHLGTDDIGNYLPSCALCNRSKSAMDLEHFRKYIEEDAPRIHFKKNRKWYADADKIVDAYGLQPKDNKVVFFFEKKGIKI